MNRFKVGDIIDFNGGQGTPNIIVRVHGEKYDTYEIYMDCYQGMLTDLFEENGDVLVTDIFRGEI